MIKNIFFAPPLKNACVARAPFDIPPPIYATESRILGYKVETKGSRIKTSEWEIMYREPMFFMLSLQIHHNTPTRNRKYVSTDIIFHLT